METRESGGLWDWAVGGSNATSAHLHSDVIDRLTDHFRDAFASGNESPPVVLTGPPGSGRQHVVEEIVARLSTDRNSGSSREPPLAALSISVHPTNDVHVHTRDSDTPQMLAELSQLGELMAALLAVTPAATVALGVQVAAAGVAVAADVMSSRKRARAATKTSVRDLVGEIGELSRTTSGLLVSITDADHAPDVGVVRLLDQVSLAKRFLPRFPVQVMLTTTPDSFDSLLRLSGQPLQRYELQRLEPDEVARWWRCSLSFAHDAVSLTKGRAGVLAELRTAIADAGFRRAEDFPPSVQAWIASKINNLIDTCLERQALQGEDYLRAARCSWIVLETLAGLGGVAPIGSIPRDLPMALIRHLGGEQSDAPSWQVLRPVGSGFLELSPLARAAIAHLRPVGTVVTPSHAADSVCFHEFLDGWVDTATDGAGFLLTMTAVNYLKEAARSDLSARAKEARRREIDRVKALHAESVLADRAEPGWLHDAVFQEAVGSLLGHLAPACPGALRVRALDASLSLLREASESRPSARLAMLHTHFLRADSVEPFSVDNEFADLLVASNDKILMSQVLGRLCWAHFEHYTEPSLRAGLHGLALDETLGSPYFWLAQFDINRLGDVLRADAVRNSVAPRLTALAELANRIPDIRHALLCADTENPALSSAGLASEAIAMLRAGRPDSDLAYHALVRALDYPGSEYQAMCAVATISLEEDRDEDEPWAVVPGFLIAAATLAEEVAPNEEAAWWAMLAQKRADRGESLSSHVLLGLACAITKDWPEVVIPVALTGRLRTEFVPRPLQWQLESVDGPPIPLTTAHKDWAAKREIGATREASIRGIERDIREANDKIPVECRVHTPVYARESLRSWLVEAGGAIGIDPYSDLAMRLELRTVATMGGE